MDEFTPDATWVVDVGERARVISEIEDRSENIFPTKEYGRPGRPNPLFSLLVPT